MHADDTDAVLGAVSAVLFVSSVFLGYAVYLAYSGQLPEVCLLIRTRATSKVAPGQWLTLRPMHVTTHVTDHNGQPSRPVSVIPSSPRTPGPGPRLRLESMSAAESDVEYANHVTIPFSNIEMGQLVGTDTTSKVFEVRSWGLRRVGDTGD